jgi:NADPH-dependent curcumin reductase
MERGTVAEVIEPGSPKWTPGDIVLSYSGLQKYTVANLDGLRKLDPSVAAVSTALGVLDMPGFTAYTGLLNIGQPKRGETVVVSAASGAVRAVVGQIAKIKGTRLVGVAGSDDKCQYVVQELGFDWCVNRHKSSFREEIKAACPNGVDVNFAMFLSLIYIFVSGWRFSTRIASCYGLAITFLSIALSLVPPAGLMIYSYYERRGRLHGETYEVRH